MIILTLFIRVKLNLSICPATLFIPVHVVYVSDKGDMFSYYTFKNQHYVICYGFILLT